MQERTEGVPAWLETELEIGLETAVACNKQPLPPQGCWEIQVDRMQPSLQ